MKTWFYKKLSSKNLHESIKNEEKTYGQCEKKQKDLYKDVNVGKNTVRFVHKIEMKPRNRIS